MSSRARNLTALGMVAAAVLLTVWLLRRASFDPVRAVPASSYLVVSIDAEALRASPLYKTVFGEEGARLLGFPSFAQACGFDPLARAEQIHVALPEAAERGDFGVVATGNVTAEELVGCGRKLVASEGETPPMRDVGTFKVIAHEATGVKIAFRRGGPAIGGRGAWIDTMMAAAEGREPPLAKNPVHTKLRADVGPGAVLVTAALPGKLRERLRRQWNVDDAAGGELAGVLGVEAIALAIDPGLPGGQAKVRLLLGCETAGKCADVQRLLERKRFEWGKEIGLRLLGLGAVLDAVTFRTEASGVSVELRYPADDLARVAERVLVARRGGAGARQQGAGVGATPTPTSDRAAAPSGSRTAPLPADERIPAKDAGGGG
jgi:hypothetical protein